MWSRWESNPDLLDANESTWAFASVDIVGRNAKQHVRTLATSANNERRRSYCGRTADGVILPRVLMQTQMPWGRSRIRLDAGVPHIGHPSEATTLDANMIELSRSTNRLSSLTIPRAPLIGEANRNVVSAGMYS